MISYNPEYIMVNTNNQPKKERKKDEANSNNEPLATGENEA